MEIRKQLADSKKPHAMLVKWVTVSAAIGVITGLSVSFLELAVLDTFDLMLSFFKLHPFLMLIIPTASLGFVGLLRDKLTERPSLHGTEEVLDAYHYQEGELSLRDVPVKIAGSILTIGSGGSAGLEGPSIHIGGAVGYAVKKVMDRLNMDGNARLLLLTGAASGIGAIFKAPLTGLMFALEVPYKDDMAHQAVVPALISSVVSYITLITILGAEPIFKHFKTYKELDLLLIGQSLLEGVIIGVMAFLFVKLTSLIESLMEGRSYWLRGLLGGLSVGALGLLSLYAYGGVYPLGLSYDVVGMSFEGGDPYFFLGLAFLKMLTTAFTLGSAGIGGVFIPSIVIGSALGSAFSSINPEGRSLFVAIGMSSFLSAAFKTPLASVTFVAETTGSEAYIIPGLIASAVSYIVTGKYSLPKNQRFVEVTTLEELGRILVGRIMTPPPPVVDADITLKEFMRRYFLKEHKYSTFPVRASNGKLIGVITVNDVDSVPTEEWDRRRVVEVLRKVEFLRPNESVLSALDKFYEYGIHCLPVVDPVTGEVVGTLSTDDVVRYLEHRRMLKKTTLFFR